MLFSSATELPAGSGAARVDLYSAYSRFGDQILTAIRQETFETDIGQNSWITIDEYDRFLSWLRLGAESHVLEVASGSGGPALYAATKTGCRVTGVDASEAGVATASQNATASGQSERVQFRLADANAPLPFEANSFDGLLCMDSMNHFPNRLGVLKEWHRLLRVGHRAVFTDPVVITGAVTNEELALRSSVGLFVFVPPGLNEMLIEQAGLWLIRQEDVTSNAALVSNRWHKARAAHKEELIQIEGEERFEGLQKFFDSVFRLTNERRLSRIVYLVEKKSDV
jgi:SAM-dependent methyltransferase